MGFQSQVNLYQAPAQAGDFAGNNPVASMVASEAGLVVGSAGVTVGKFAWAASGSVANAYALGGRMGFVHREQKASITTWLAANGVTVQAGSEIGLLVAGDVWAAFAAGATIGQAVYAQYADGSAVAGSTAPTTTATISTTSASSTITVTAVTGTPLAVGQPVSGTGIPTGAYIAALGTGTGGTGTYVLSANATATGTGVTMTVTTAEETAFTVCSTCLAGELAKISTWS